MSNLEIVKPQIIDGIEFYVSKDGKQCGTSQRGLARLCGIDVTSLMRLLKELSEKEVLAKRAQKILEDCQGEDLHCGLTSNQNARVISSTYVAAIIEHYAFDVGLDVAKFSYRKFAKIGIDGWIKEVIGYASPLNLDGLQASLNQLIEMHGETNQRLKVLEESTLGYRKVSVEMPGLKEWMENCAVEDPGVPAIESGEPEEMFSLAEYLAMEKGLRFEKPLMARFSNQVSYIYRTMKLQVPGKKKTIVATGYSGPPTNCYRRQDFPLLDIAFKQAMMSV